MSAATKTNRTNRFAGAGAPQVAEVAELHPLTTKTIKVTIKGITPLICDALPSETQDFLSKSKPEQQASKDKDKPKLTDAMRLELASYKTSSGAYGFPATAFRKAMINFAHVELGLPKTKMNKAMFVIADVDDLVLIKHRLKPKLIRDIARNKGGTPAPRYRCQFDEWGATLTIRYNTRILVAETIINLLQNTGFGIGIGNKRPELKGGYSNGQWEVES